MKQFKTVIILFILYCLLSCQTRGRKEPENKALPPERLVIDFEKKADRQDKPAAFFPDGKGFITSTVSSLQLWDIGTMKPKEVRLRWYPFAVAVSPDGRRIVVGGYSRTALLLDRDGKTVRSLPGHSSHVSNLAYSPTNKFFVTASRGLCKMWRPNGRLLKTLHPLPSWIFDMDISPDGGKIGLAFNDSSRLQVLDISGRKIVTIKEDYVRSVAFAADSKSIFAGSFKGLKGAVRHWDLKGKLIKAYPMTDIVERIRLLQGGNLLAIEFNDHQPLSLLNLKDSSLRGFPTITRHHYVTHSLSRHPEKKIILTCAWPSRGYLFLNYETGDYLRFFHFPSGDWVAWDGENRFDCSPGAEKYIRFYRGEAVQPYEQARARYYTKGLLKRFLQE